MRQRTVLFLRLNLYTGMAQIIGAVSSKTKLFASPIGCRYRLRQKEVIDLRTYQDLQAVGKNEKARIAFVEDVIREHKASSSY